MTIIVADLNLGSFVLHVQTADFHSMVKYTLLALLCCNIVLDICIQVIQLSCVLVLAGNKVINEEKNVLFRCLDYHLALLFELNV
jgi:hypothetical protein